MANKFDVTQNFAKGTLAAGIDAAVTSLTVGSGEGSLFPATPFNATIWNSTDNADPADDSTKELVRVTVIAGDVFTITRGQENTTGQVHNVGGKTYKITQDLTSKMWTDIISRFNDIEDVKQHNALGDDAADDGAEIQAAIDAAETAGGGIVVIPRGTYKFATTLTLPPNVILRGYGYGVSVLKYTGSAIAFDVNDGGAGNVSYESSIEDLKIIDDGTGTSGLRLVGASHFAIIRCRVTGFTSGVHFQGSAARPVTGIKITDCSIDGNVNGITADTANNTNNQIRVEGCRIASNSTRGVEHNVDARAWTFINNDIAGNTVGGMRLAWCIGCKIIGNYFEETAAVTSIEFNPALNQTPGGISITGNHFQGLGGTTCIIVGAAGLNFGVNGLNIVGNFFNNYTNAVDLADARNATVKDNFLSGSIVLMPVPGANTENVTVQDGDTTKNIVGFGASLDETFKIELSPVLAGADEDMTDFIPAGSMLIGVSYIIETVVGGATTIDIGDGTTVDLFGADIAVAAGTKGDSFTDGTQADAKVYHAATVLKFTAVGGSFTGAGKVRVCLHYKKMTALTS